MAEILNIHLVSDSSVYALKGAITSALAHFPDMETKKHYWPLIKHEKALEKAFEEMKSYEGVILYDISNKKIRKALRDFCNKSNLPSISLVGSVVDEITSYMKIEARDVTDAFANQQDSYFARVSAIEFAISHDDGQKVEDISFADIILVGPSRVSKTPTSFYLAYDGFKAANIPYILGNDLPEYLFTATQPLIVGLIIDPERLTELRETRMAGAYSSDYMNLEFVKEECHQARMLFTKNNWPVIDVTRRSVEETAAMITKLYYEKNRFCEYE